MVVQFQGSKLCVESGRRKAPKNLEARFHKMQDFSPFLIDRRPRKYYQVFSCRLLVKVGEERRGATDQLEIKCKILEDLNFHSLGFGRITRQGIY